MNLRWLPTPIYAFIYRSIMRLAHRFNWHYAPPCYPEGDTMLWCHWCGFKAVVKKAAYKSPFPLPLTPECASGVARQSSNPSDEVSQPRAGARRTQVRAVASEGAGPNLVDGPTGTKASCPGFLDCVTDLNRCLHCGVRSEDHS